MSRVRIKRAYEPTERGDGIRVLVDRLWPRGLKRDAARIDHWLKGAAPSTELRRWFGHDPVHWTEFRRRYRAELAEGAADVAALRTLVKGSRPVTLIYAARDLEHNHALVLRDFIASPHRGR